MTEAELLHAARLAALGAPARLAALRLLVRAGDDGVTVGDLQRRLDMAPSTLAHHLSSLVDAGLVRQARRGREVWCTADFTALRQTADFLIEACCQGLEPLSDVRRLA
ncbi:metalloregulator ArsR/SmtB family transcription factor [Brevundimonas sp.]|uniref:ArsR/SmtB family transcription factor n=1 Tax=Brevundimonas sp. TaxID=1871086 RepID=UPI0026377F5F|nr:metalloregulator ArsR/SmtB family transcription factor [Brevundimonas sp.]